MRPPVKPKPLAVCSVCHALSSRREDLNHRCRNALHGRRCYGIFQSALTHLWDRCESCEGVGRVGTQDCAECAGFGWKMYA